MLRARESMKHFSLKELVFGSNSFVVPIFGVKYTSESSRCGDILTGLMKINTINKGKAFLCYFLC